MSTPLKEKKGLVNRALAKANGGNIHDVRVLCGYYRSAISLSTDYKRLGLDEKAEQRRQEVARYEQLLEHFAYCGSWPNRKR